MRVEALLLWRRANVGELSAEIVRVEALSLWRESVLVAANPRWRLCVSMRSRCDAVRICFELGEPSAAILRVEALSPWRRSICLLLCLRIVFGSCLVVRASAFTIARCLGFQLPGPRQLRLVIAKVAREEQTQSSGCNITTHKSSTRSALPQLRREIRKFKYKRSCAKCTPVPQLRRKFKYKSRSRRAFPEAST